MLNAGVKHYETTFLVHSGKKMYLSNTGFKDKNIKENIHKLVEELDLANVMLNARVKHYKYTPLIHSRKYYSTFSLHRGILVTLPCLLL